MINISIIYWRKGFIIGYSKDFYWMSKFAYKSGWLKSPYSVFMFLISQLLISLTEKWWEFPQTGLSQFENIHCYNFA